jgi:hypothetical protein
MKKLFVTFLAAIFSSILLSLIGCTNHPKTKVEESPYYKMINKLLSQKYNCDSILNISEIDSCMSSIYFDSYYDRRTTELHELKERLAEEKVAVNKYSDGYSEKGRYLESKHTYNSEYLKQRIYDLEEELSHYREHYTPYIDHYRVFVKYRAKYAFRTEIKLCSVDLTRSGELQSENIRMVAETAMPFYDASFKKFGIMEAHLLDTLVPAKYDSIFATPSIRDNMLVAKLNNKYGVIYYSGEIILPFEYDNIYGAIYNEGENKMDVLNNLKSFSFIVCQDKKMGVVQESKWIIPCRYNAILIPYDCQFSGDDGGYFAYAAPQNLNIYVNEGGHLMGFYHIVDLSCKKDSINGKWGAYNQYGKELLPVEFSLGDAFTKTGQSQHKNIIK